jgi:DNA polymerase alpha subunit B
MMISNRTSLYMLVLRMVEPQMDFRQAHHWQMHTSPDVLILPSKLAAMARDVNGSLVINPGTLVKGSSAGTFAELHIHPMPEDSIRDALIAGKTAIPHQVPSRTKVAIKKI